jgi:uncharacterized protein YceK
MSVFVIMCALVLLATVVAACASVVALTISRKNHARAQYAQERTEAYHRMLAAWNNSVTQCAHLDQAVRQVEIRQGRRSKTGTRLGHIVR